MILLTFREIIAFYTVKWLLIRQIKNPLTFHGSAILDFTHNAIRRLLLSFHRTTLVKFTTINILAIKNATKNLLMSLK